MSVISQRPQSLPLQASQAPSASVNTFQNQIVVAIVDVAAAVAVVVVDVAAAVVAGGVAAAVVVVVAGGVAVAGGVEGLPCDGSTAEGCAGPPHHRASSAV